MAFWDGNVLLCRAFLLFQCSREHREEVSWRDKAVDICLGVSRGPWACQEEKCGVKTCALCSPFTNDIIYAASTAVGARGGTLLRVSQLCHAPIVAFQGYPENGTLCSHSQMRVIAGDTLYFVSYRFLSSPWLSVCLLIFRVGGKESRNLSAFWGCSKLLSSFWTDITHTHSCMHLHW